MSILETSESPAFRSEVYETPNQAWNKRFKQFVIIYGIIKKNNERHVLLERNVQLIEGEEKIDQEKSTCL